MFGRFWIAFLAFFLLLLILPRDKNDEETSITTLTIGGAYLVIISKMSLFPNYLRNHMPNFFWVTGRMVSHTLLSYYASLGPFLSPDNWPSGRRACFEFVMHIEGSRR